MDEIKNRESEARQSVDTRRPIVRGAPVSTEVPKAENKPPKKATKKRFRSYRVKKKVVTWSLQPNGLFVWKPPKIIRKLLSFCQKHRLASRVIALTLASIILFLVFFDAFQQYFKEAQYKISPKADALVVKQNDLFASKLKYDQKSNSYQYNEGYSAASEDVAGQVSGPKFSANFNVDPAKGVQITDPEHSTTITIKPKFRLESPRQEKNRLVYPLPGKQAAKVLTVRAGSMKEDIILEKSYGDSMKFDYELELPEGLEARLETDGSLGVYGSGNKALLGNVSTGNEKDAELLKKARQNSQKTTLIFRMPAPYIRESGSKIVKRSAKFELKDKTLTLKADHLKNLRYPVSIDPTVYIETAAKLMRGNNETNTDFDVDDELIQKSQLSGARIDSWEGNLDFNNGVWDHATTAAGGYVYRSGGRADPTKPTIVDQTETFQNSDSATFTMNMPTTRPAGDLYLALMCYDGSQGDGTGGSTAGNNISTPTGWTKYAGRQGHAAYYKVGTDQGGGNEASTYQFTGDSEEWGGVIVRVTGFNSSDPVSGTPGEGHSTSSVTPVFPATTPDSDSTLVIRAVGADADEPSTSAWVPSGHTKIASGGSTGSNDCAFTAASLDTPPASGVSSGTATLADASISDDYGASSIAINPATVTAGTQATVQWAKFNSTTLAIESPNPGTGACSGWCSNSAYDLPEARRSHSMVAYNGYLYVIGGSDGTNRESTVFIAKLGANGEPQLWHPTGGTPAYWYTDTGLNGATARSYLSAVAYNNRMYVLGGQTNASTGGVTTVEYADILPNGRIGTWSSGTALPSARHSQTVLVYNDTLYLIGGNSSGTLQSTTYYSILQVTGNPNTWTATTSFTTARSSMGGNFATVLGAYVYLTGGCSAVNGSGYCTTIASDTQIGSINADGTISEWTAISSLTNSRVGYSILGWQGGLYRLGGCAQQNTTTGVCINALADVDYGVVNPAGEVSTVDISVPSGGAPCSGASPYSCDLPPPGDDAGEGGQMLSMTAILNGYLYVIGGCVEYDCDDADGSGDNTGSDLNLPASDDIEASGNTSFAVINSNGRLTKPATCSGTSYGSWCVNSTDRINGTTGIAAGGVTTFNNRIYIVGGLTGNGISTNIYYNVVSGSNGNFTGAWSSTDMTTAGIAEDVAYTFAFTRANPGTADTLPGDLFVIGGCGTNTGGAGCASSDYETEVYNCDIATAGSVSGCTTTGQLQLDVELSDETNQGLGIHSGAVYADRVYLIGGFSANVSDRDTVFYAKISSSNNIVSNSTGAVSGDGDDWIESTSTLSVGRRRGWAFGYNGHIYAVGGYDDSGTGIIPFIEWAKMDVSDGDVDPFVTSTVTINQRWGLSMIVSNSYAYVIGGCDVGASPGSCSSFENSIQTFQLYNNNSGTPEAYTATSDQTFGTDNNRKGSSAAVLNGYIYVAGGCVTVGVFACTDATNSTVYAAISTVDGTVGSWSSTGNLGGDRAFGALQAAGGSLYYMGGHNDTPTYTKAVYYATPGGGGTITWNASSNDLPAARAFFGSAVWNNRIYALGGESGAGVVTSTVYVSPQLNSGGNITSAWSSTTAFNTARWGTAAVAYANNLYIMGGQNSAGTLLNDVQYTQINSDGTVDTWKDTTSMPRALRGHTAVAYNGYIYVLGGGTSSTVCYPRTLVVPVSANTTIDSGNNPTGIGEWYQTNSNYVGDRDFAAVTQYRGKLFMFGGGCDNGSPNPLTSDRHWYTTLKTQPQVAKYSRMIDTDTDVFPNSWLANGLDNSTGARWNAYYASMNDIDGVPTDCGTADMSTWGQYTTHGEVTLGTVNSYTPKDGSGNNINCARYYYIYMYIDASLTFGYPEDVSRGPTITDLSLFFTSDPSKRLRHGKTFTGGEQQPLDTPCRQSGGQANCPLP